MVKVKRKLDETPMPRVNVQAVCKSIKRKVSGVYEERIMSVLKRLAK